MQQSTASPRLVLGECVRGRGEADTPNSEQCVVGSLFEHAISNFKVPRAPCRACACWNARLRRNGATLLRLLGDVPECRSQQPAVAKREGRNEHGQGREGALRLGQRVTPAAATDYDKGVPGGYPEDTRVRKETKSIIIL